MSRIPPVHSYFKNVIFLTQIADELLNEIVVYHISYCSQQMRNRVSVIATSRIDKYDGEMVTFHYNRHEDEQYVEETIPAMEFIQRLIRHIPEKNYKMIRYGGLYARHREIDSKMLLQMFKTMLTENTELSDDKIDELVETFMNALPALLKTQLQAA